MRIAVIITALGLGGAEALLLTIAQTIDRSRFKLTFFCLYDEDNRLIPDFRAAGYDVQVVRVFDYARHFLFRYDVRAILRLARLLRRGQYDLVQTHLGHANTVGRLAALLAGRLPTIVTEHNTVIKSAWQVRWDRLLARWTDRILCVSESVKAYVCSQPGIPPERCTVIYNAIDVDAYRSTATRADAKAALGLAADVPVAGSVGRLHPQKAYGDLLDAFAIVAAQHPTAQLVLAGDGKERATLEAQTARLGLTARVHFLGFRRDVPTILRAFDLFVMSSYYEGFATVTMETMAAGTPILSTDIPPSKEIIRHDENGWLAPVKNPPALAEAILHLLGDDALRARLAEAGRRTVDTQFTADVMVRALEGLFTDVAGAAAAPAPRHA